MTTLGPDSSNRLWYLQPAASWEEALPIGNGKLGGMVFGGVESERIDLNEDTLWSGFSRDPNNYDAIRHLARIREAVTHGRFKEAEEIAERHMLGSWNESYLPLGTLHIRQHGLQAIEQYERELNLKTGIVSSSFFSEGMSYTREAFASAPDKLIVLKYTSAGRGGSLSLSVKLESLLQHNGQIVRSMDDSSVDVMIQGNCPSHVEPNYVEDHPNPILYEEGLGLRYAISLRMIVDNGSINWNDNGDLEIRQADSVTILLSGVTDFSEEQSNSCTPELDLNAIGLLRLNKGSMITYAELKERHLADIGELLERVELRLETTSTSLLPTDLRLEAVKDGAEDPALAALYYHYGRYLLISSSREGSQPANLQGIWSKEIRAPWGSNWTTNINIQMNYWHVETANLSECHKPLLAWIRKLSSKGKRTARIHYDCRGWVAHHNVDIWLDTSPASGQAVWALWPMAGAWLCRHLWEHYSFNEDSVYLEKDAYPIMREAALFYLDWLVPDNKSPFLVTNPSTSPENKFVTKAGDPCAVTKASTLDLLLIRELFTHCIAASEILNQDAKLRVELFDALSKLYPLQIGSGGRLQEWAEDFEEWEPGHRHLSHLYGLYPGDLLQYDRDVEFVQACRRSLEHRLANGGGYTGWSCAWSMALWARLRNGAEFHKSWLSLLRTSTFPNLLDGHPYMVDTTIDYSRSIFQIDGNFGTTAAIGELLLQSHENEIHLLPALPPQWREGSVRGFRARSGFTVNMSWSNGKITEVSMGSDNGGLCRVRSAIPLTTEALDSMLCTTRNGFYSYEFFIPAGEDVFMKGVLYP
ncbi:hypothetical protein R50345_09950 [Paenibacillus sp. FSL R5-0345]|uniref:glycoside hydrolase family 95 protein n=1 Tax=Paenibacillus sp. FSL R5-0345 TaxID=1536770 RepID=UPI0004F73716|nr:glycoside hydrolase family 95 protein [Paenibacillus sp. FSL R5-0345]AIQ34901.1 hypothetical protein R50345_09950 [Paenibacillus sp. FSL R5-0345]